MTDDDGLTECPACAGPLRAEARSGRMSAGYVIPATLAIPTCTRCGARWVDETHLRAISDYPGVRYRPR